MLLLVPASLAANSLKIAELLLGLFGLGGAVLFLVAGIWLRFRWVNVMALLLSGGAAFLFRVLSHTAKLNVPAGILCVTSIAVAVVALWRAARSTGTTSVSPRLRVTSTSGAGDSAEDGNRLRLRRRKRRLEGNHSPHNASDADE